VEPIDRRITAATLLSLREQPNAGDEIAALLGVRTMSEGDALRTLQAIATFLRSGDATIAAQLIHAAGVRSETKGPGRRDS
jgi:hypothetical protein